MSGEDRIAQDATAVARRGARRRNITEPGGRTLRTVVKMNAEEKAYVTALARQQKISVPALFMRAVVTGGTDAAARYEQLREELAAARRVLVGLAANVNQLARQANAHAAGDPAPAVTVAQLRAAADAVHRVVERIDALTSRVAPTSADTDGAVDVDADDDEEWEAGVEHDGPGTGDGGAS
ncbi:plasmid mobilization relaxosome protein MobC [uncultured Cellulomonas sp.]|uniref:plasmid mobilization relaxosome protein MobC n=1 Tax=uncultured Cellulomonas sp. TaxID=189682 RepID=UPI00260FCA7B|nr:plasmid mobilization relaxosome protein MobC [uncultured Cellulomonas sp.]